MDELIDLLVALLGRREVQLDDDKGGGQARALVAMQNGLYDTFFSSFRNVPFTAARGQGHASIGNEAENAFSSMAKLVATNPPTIVPTSKSVTRVESVFPILWDDDVQKLRDFILQPKELTRTPEEAKRFSLMAAAALVVETSETLSKPLLQQAEIAGKIDQVDLMVFISRYAAAKYRDQTAPLVETRVAAELASFSATLANHRAEFDKERADQRGALDALAAASVEIDQKSTGVAEALVKFRDDLANHEAAIREEWKLNRARLNWNQRYLEARRGFKIACGLLALFLAVTMIIAISYGSAIVASVNHFDIGLFLSGGSASTAIAHQLSRLIVFSVPILVYLWMLKAVMRYFMRSLLLMDDARQRETMLDTYLLLTEKGRADERDRPLILWALFRQTPGHGPDGIEPPDFTEVINAGFNRSKTAPG